MIYYEPIKSSFKDRRAIITSNSYYFKRFLYEFPCKLLAGMRVIRSLIDLHDLSNIQNIVLNLEAYRSSF